MLGTVGEPGGSTCSTIPIQPVPCCPTHPMGAKTPPNLAPEMSRAAITRFLWTWHVYKICNEPLVLLNERGSRDSKQQEKYSNIPANRRPETSASLR